MTEKRHIFLVIAVLGAVFAFGLTAFVPAIAQLGDEILNRANNTTNNTETASDNATDFTTTNASNFILEDGTIDCDALANELGGIGVPNGDVCDVVVVRQTPTITTFNNITQENMTMNQFTLMNSVLEFLPIANDTSNSTEVYVMGDFALLETEMNPVLQIVTENDWTVTGIHNHMINETPKTSFMHWEVQGDISDIIENANEAFEATSIK